jgi:hypothetical protein
MIGMAIDDEEATDLSVAPVVGPDDPRRFTDSGIEIKPLYDEDDVAPDLEERRRRRLKLVAVAGGAAFCAGAFAAPAANAATFTVTNLSDSDPGSLRDAVDSANAAGGTDDIVFQSGLTGEIGLTSGEILVTDGVNIQGPGASALTVDADDDTRVFVAYMDDPGDEIAARYSLIETPGSPFADQGRNIIGKDPQLGALASNGGPTQTRLPSGTSPVLDKGIAGGLATDQRGAVRPFDFPGITSSPGGDAADMGAVESGVVNSPAPAKKKKKKCKKKRKKGKAAAAKKKCKKKKKKK